MEDVADKVLNEGKELVVAGREIKVKKFSFVRHTKLVSGLLAKVLPSIAAADNNLQVGGVIFELLHSDFDKVLKLIKDLTGLTDKDIEKLEAKDEMALFDIAMGVYEVNQPFLLRLRKRMGM